MNKKIIIISSLFLAILIMGCIGGNGEDFEETELDVEEGIGILDTLKIDELRPGLSGFVSLTLRSNLEGIGASDIIVSLDNVRPFKIMECGDEFGGRNLSKTRSEISDDYGIICRGDLDKDEDLPLVSRGTSRIFPGEELEVSWRLRAPDKDDISDIALEHPLYYNIKYSYSVNFRQNIVFMSQEEMLRRRERGEDYVITGETGSTAGEIRFSGATRQPIYYAFDHQPRGGNERPFDFVLSYSIQNRGRGFPISDIVLIMQYPGESIGYDESLLEDYGWLTREKMDELEGNDRCHDGEKLRDCIEWLEEILDEDWENINESEDVLFRVIRRGDFIDSFNIHTPLEIKTQEMNDLRDDNIPIRIYSFNVHAVYRYYTEGKEYINVFPLRGI